MKNLLTSISIVVAFLGIIGCQDLTHNLLRPGDVERYINYSGDGSVCLENGIETACLTLTPKNAGTDKTIGAPVIHIHPRKLVYIFYYEVRQILRAERATDTTEIRKTFDTPTQILDDPPPSDTTAADDGDNVVKTPLTPLSPPPVRSVPIFSEPVSEPVVNIDPPPVVNTDPPPEDTTQLPPPHRQEIPTQHRKIPYLRQAASMHTTFITKTSLCRLCEGKKTTCFFRGSHMKLRVGKVLKVLIETDYIEWAERASPHAVILHFISGEHLHVTCGIKSKAPLFGVKMPMPSFRPCLIGMLSNSTPNRP